MKKNSQDELHPESNTICFSLDDKLTFGLDLVLNGLIHLGTLG
jgi:hypothetical protein